MKQHRVPCCAGLHCLLLTVLGTFLSLGLLSGCMTRAIGDIYGQEKIAKFSQKGKYDKALDFEAKLNRRYKTDQERVRACGPLTMTAILSLHNRLGDHERVFELGEIYRNELGSSEFHFRRDYGRTREKTLIGLTLIPYLQSALEMGELDRFDEMVASIEETWQAHQDWLRKTYPKRADRIIERYSNDIDLEPLMEAHRLQRSLYDLDTPREALIERFRAESVDVKKAEVIRAASIDSLFNRAVLALVPASKKVKKAKVRYMYTGSMMDPNLLRGIALLHGGYVLQDPMVIRENKQFAEKRPRIWSGYGSVLAWYTPIFTLYFPITLITCTTIGGKYGPFLMGYLYKAPFGRSQLLPTGDEYFYEGFADFLEGKREDAVPKLERYLASVGKHSTSCSDFIWTAYDSLGSCYEQMEQPERALENYQLALKASEREREFLRRDSYKRRFLQKRDHPYERAASLLARQGDSEGAFAVVEKTKARALMDLLEGKALGKTQEVEAGYLAYQRESVLAPLAGKPETELASLPDATGKGEERRRSLAKKQEELRAVDRELASLANAESPTWPDVAALLPDGVCLIEFFVGTEEGLVFVGQSGKLRSIAIPKGRDEIRRLTEEVRKAVAQGASDVVTPCQQAYDVLLRDAFPDGLPERIVVVPHGPLHILPFAALHDGEKWLIERAELAVLPASSALPYCLAKKSLAVEKVLILANPNLTQTLPKLSPARWALPAAETEADRLAGLLGAKAHVYVGGEATEAVFKEEAPGADVVHLACHGVFDDKSPSRSALMLAAGGEEDGRLEVWEIMKTSLNARLVTMSACETALGDISAGDDVVGLTRGMLYAGTPTILASLWEVHDHATKELMLEFYRHYLEGEGAGSALRKAQLRLLGQTGRGTVAIQRGIGVTAVQVAPVAAQELDRPTTTAPYSHPYFWACFQVVGNWQ